MFMMSFSAYGLKSALNQTKVKSKYKLLFVSFKVLQLQMSIKHAGK